MSDATPWEKAMCGAGGGSDKYQRVFFKCSPEGSKKARDFGVFLRSAKGTEPWALFSVDTDTSTMFQGQALEDGAAKRRESLNEDLK